jgi:hypothetical protein
VTLKAGAPQNTGLKRKVSGLTNGLESMQKKAAILGNAINTKFV